MSAIANDIGTDAIFSRQVIAYGREGDVLLAISTSGNSANVIAALAEARARRLRTIAMVGYDGGRVSAERLADHVVVTRSEHIPRIQEAQASAYHLLRELVELSGARARPAGASAWKGHGAGRGLPSLRLPAGRGARRGRPRAERRAGCGRGGGGAARDRGALPRPAARRGAAAGERRAGDRRGARRARRAGLLDPREHERRRAARRGHARQRHLPRLPRRAVRPVGQALSLPVRELHELRAALHDRARRPVRPAQHHDGRLRDVRGLPGRVQRSGRPSLPRPAQRLPRVRAASAARSTPTGARSTTPAPSTPWTPRRVRCGAGPSSR